MGITSATPLLYSIYDEVLKKKKKNFFWKIVYIAFSGVSSVRIGNCYRIPNVVFRNVWRKNQTTLGPSIGEYEHFATFLMLEHMYS